MTYTNDGYFLNTIDLRHTGYWVDWQIGKPEFSIEDRAKHE